MKNLKHGVSMDFGTKMNVVAVTNEAQIKTGEEPFIAYNEPSIIAFDPQICQIVIGNEAQNVLALYGFDYVITDIKSKLRENPNFINESVNLGDASFCVKELLQTSAKKIMDTVRRNILANGYTTDEIGQLTITYPCGVGENIMMASEYASILKDIYQEETNLSDQNIHLRLEPICAVYNLIDKRKRNNWNRSERIMAVDLGGGTLDIAIVEYDAKTGEMTVLTSDGNLNLGGRDYNKPLADDIMFCEASGLEFKDNRQKADFEYQVEKLKIELSKSKVSASAVEIGDDIVTFTRTRIEFEDLPKVKDLSCGIIELAKNTMLFGGSVDTIFLTGGASKMPHVKAMFEEHFIECEIVQDEHSETSVARGAALMAMPEDIAGTLVNQVVPHTYGYISYKNNTDEMIYNMLIKDTPYDKECSVKAGEPFRARFDTQTSISFKVFESDCRDQEPWQQIMGDEKYCGIKVTVQIPIEYYGRATEFLVYPTMKYTSSGMFEFVVIDELGNEIACCNCQNISAK